MNGRAMAAPEVGDSTRATLRPGVRLGVDVGTVRLGVAASDPDAVLAMPVETVGRGGPADRIDLRRLGELVAERDAIEVIVGLPLSLTGARGRAAEAALDYARELAAVVAPVPVRVIDERLSTVAAHGQLRAAGRRSRARREIVDQAAAVIILQAALDSERASGQPPGEVVTAS